MPATEETIKTAEELESERIAAEKAAQPTEDEQKALNELAGDLLGIKPEEKKEPEKKPDATPEKKPKAKKKAPEPKPEPVEPPDYEKIAEAAGRGAATALKPREEKNEPEKKDEYADMPEKERRKVPVLQQMETMFPERYKGITKRYADSLKATMEYQSKWEAENPGKEFDPEDEEHNAFYAKHEVDWEDDDFIEAKAEMVATRHVKAIEEKTEKQLGEFKSREKAREMEPLAYREGKRVGRKAFEIVGDEFNKIISEDGTVDKAAVAKIAESDPLAADIIFKEISRIENICMESYRLHNRMVEFDANNPDHKFLAKYAEMQQDEILSLPKAQQVNEKGQKFAIASDYNEMSDSEKSRHYRLTGEDLNDLLALELGSKAKKLLEGERKRLETMATKYGYKKGETTATEKTEPEPEPDDEKPVPVTTTTDALVSTTEKQRQHKPLTGEAAFVNDFLKS